MRLSWDFTNHRPSLATTPLRYEAPASIILRWSYLNKVVPTKIRHRLQCGEVSGGFRRAGGSVQLLQSVARPLQTETLTLENLHQCSPVEVRVFFKQQVLRHHGRQCAPTLLTKSLLNLKKNIYNELKFPTWRCWLFFVLQLLPLRWESWNVEGVSNKRVT